MPGNLRRKIDKGRRTEVHYLRARKRAFGVSQICGGCGKAVDLTLKPICQYVDTKDYTAENAHEIPWVCGPGCREAGHQRKANPWSASADHKIPVDELPPDSPLLTSHKNLETYHLICNQRKGNRKDGRARIKTSRDWFA